MRREIVIERIERISYECERHTLRISEAVGDLESIMPLDSTTYLALEKEEVQALDQFLFRFSKLQDAIGRKLFKQILMLKEDDELLISNMPFIDILNSLEKLGLLERRDWQRLRDIRNELAHNYDDAPAEMAEAINRIYDERDTLIGIYIQTNAYFEKIR